MTLFSSVPPGVCRYSTLNKATIASYQTLSHSSHPLTTISPTLHSLVTEKASSNKVPSNRSVWTDTGVAADQLGHFDADLVWKQSLPNVADERPSTQKNGMYQFKSFPKPSTAACEPLPPSAASHPSSCTPEWTVSQQIEIVNLIVDCRGWRESQLARNEPIVSIYQPPTLGH
jgi:hypothetical protein